MTKRPADDADGDAEKIEKINKRACVESGEKVCSLDADDSDRDIWFEPRSVSDLKLQVILSDTETVTVHLHRVRVMEQSEWLRLRIEELIKDRSEARIVFPEGVGPFRSREEIQVTFDIMAGGDCTPPYGGPLFLRVLHALDFFCCVHIQAMFNRLKKGEGELKKLPIRERVDLAKRYKLEWIFKGIAQDLVEGIASEGLLILSSDAVVATALSPHLFSLCTAALTRAKTAESTLDKVENIVVGFFDSFSGDSKEHCTEGDDCDHRPSEHEVNHEDTNESDYDDVPLTALRRIHELV